MLKIKDLKKGEIYYGSWENGDKRCIFKQGVAAINSLDQFDNYSKEWCTSSIVTLRESTLGEKHWLNECIKANKFISYEEAMKTFKPQYIVNKWYKVKDWKFSYYVKFKSLEKVGYNKINGEIINAGTYKGDDYLANDQMEEKLELLEDLSEIQEFLPSNHPDKVPTSLVGRYLKALKNNGANIPEGEFGIIKEEGNNYHRTEFTKYGTHSVTFNNGYFELMPVGFCLDNVIPEYVECVNSWHKDWTTGKIYKTEEVQQYFPEKLTVKCDKGIATNVEEWDVRKGFGGGFKISTKELYQAQNKPTIKEKPMETNNEFKVGEYVITKGYSTDYDGRVLKITKISNGYYYFEILDNGYYNKNHNFDDRCILRRAKLEEIPTKDLSNEELLSIAKTYYPIGTKFICPSFTKATENNEGNIVTHHAISISYNGTITGSGFYYLRHDNKWAEIISSPNEIKGIKPSDEIEIGDCIQYEDGKFYTVKSNNPVYLIHDDNISRHYCNTLEYLNTIKQFKLIRKANNTTTLTQTKKDDVLSPKVENKVTVQIIERKIKNPILNISVQEENQSIFVPLIQKETKKINNITIKNFSLTV